MTRGQKYLGRYTHRVAISNQRLVAMNDGHVSFQWKDYRQGNQAKVMKLERVRLARGELLGLLASQQAIVSAGNQPHGQHGDRSATLFAKAPPDVDRLMRAIVGAPPPPAVPDHTFRMAPRTEARKLARLAPRPHSMR